ncbi:LysR family transcriptional regulator [Pusillimonas sp. ANT_WB101]|uniref:LysR family transcriptional regulator n=1 Tax=Pusillimonas sp. ANT_WB101 TaxID=2597356 RepID=UPI0011EF3887|nr:LysR family transcriptional regulator [Pusillimonas sp. ANT_WB101]KAA0890923.1 LysR family transcriptional regulator [Pusillimonas sp. ANT_WB101]
MSNNLLQHIPSGAPDALAGSFVTSYAGVVAFLAVADEGSFSRASDRLGIGRSAVSRSVQKLETQLDARLFHRTTRSTSLTREGELFYKNCQPGVKRIVHALEDMRELRDGPPHGHLCLHATPGFGRKVIGPLLQGFHAQFPDITLELLLDDRRADFTADRIDISFRDGQMEDSDIVARQLIPMRQVVCASPLYAKTTGLPRHIDDLNAHHCINFRTPSGRIRDWEFKVGGIEQKHPLSGQYIFNDLDLVLQAVLQGQGLAQLPDYLVSDLCKTQQLLTCLDQYAPDTGGHYLCYLSRKQLPARIRVFIDYIIEQTRTMNLQCLAAQAQNFYASLPLELQIN